MDSRIRREASRFRRGWLLSAAACTTLAAGYQGVAFAGQQADQQSLSSPRRADPRATVDSDQLAVEHAECAFFGPERDRFVPRLRVESPSGALTRQFSAMTASRRGSTNHSNAIREKAFDDASQGSGNLIDQYIWADLQANGITPAGKTDDYEFMRRVSLDVTGRIPKPNDVVMFAVNSDPKKREKLIDQLLASSTWVDKWTMYYGDLFMNTAAAVQVNRRAEGRNAFYKWIHDSIAEGKPYNQMATELITAEGTNSFDQTQGQINWLAGYVVNGGPSQDIFDSQAAGVASTFLGVTHVNCVLCHNGRGHLDTLSLWGSKTTRAQAWGLSSFLSHTNTSRVSTPIDPGNPNGKNAVVQYFSLAKYTTDYALNTTTGNRPARQPIGTLKTIAPAYLWGGGAPQKGEDYRAALARNVTGDFQFARAAVNYVWAQYFGRGIVDPPDQFDPMRLDPDNPPAEPWKLQPSNPKLLNALAQFFIDNNYDLRSLMRLIANSDAYQLTSRYDGDWDPNWEPFFARKLVRRLWAEEVHDAVVTATGMTVQYTVPGFTADSAIYGVTSPGFGKIQFAMQAPDVVNMPDGNGAISQFMDAFLRGNRDDAPRKQEGSILQALNLMNDNFVMSRVHATGTGPTSSYLQLIMNLPDSQLVDTLFLSVLSRHPSSAEAQTSLAYLLRSSARKTNAEDLMWSLFNKVDFVFNY